MNLPFLVSMLFFLLLQGPQALAHDKTSWLLDDQAFESVQWVGKQSSLLPLENFRSFPIDASRMRQLLEEFSGVRAVTLRGHSDPIFIRERGTQQGRELARQYLLQKFENIGLQTSLHQYRGGSNVVAERPGLDRTQVLVISAHLDSVRNAGANDDGTGIVAMIAIAEALANIELRYDLRFVAFDQEESGLIGSQAYVRSLNQNQRVIGDIQMEMMGYHSRNDGGFHVIDCDRQDSRFLTESIMGAVSSLNLPLNRVATCTTRSDHSNFWNAQIPAVVLSENFFGGDSDPCYHRSCDIVDQRINWNYFGSIVEAVASASAHLVEL